MSQRVIVVTELGAGDWATAQLEASSESGLPFGMTWLSPTGAEPPTHVGNEMYVNDASMACLQAATAGITLFVESGWDAVLSGMGLQIVTGAAR